MLDEFCPDCGTHRIALFRFCRECGLDYDELDARGELPGGPYSAIQAEPASGIRASVRRDAAQASTQRGARRGRGLGRFLPVGLAAVLAVAVVGALAIGTGLGTMTTGATGSAPPGLGAVTPSDALVPSASLAAAAAAPVGGVEVAAPAEVPGAIPSATPEPLLAPTGETMQATVTRVIDGDTIVVDADGKEFRVRYLGMDAPALVNLDRPVEYMAQEAADANRALVSSAAVVLERDVTDTDQYGQLLRHVWVEHDGQLILVGLDLVRAGLARATASGDDVRHAAAFADAQQAAKAAAIGMWGDPPLPVTGETAAPAETALPRLVGVAPVSVFSSVPAEFRGEPGIYTWRSVTFGDPTTTVRWDVGSSATRGCQFDWRLDPASGTGVGATVVVNGRDRASGERVEVTGFTEAVLVVTTTCPDWMLSLQGTAAP